MHWQCLHEALIYEKQGGGYICSVQKRGLHKGVISIYQLGCSFFYGMVPMYLIKFIKGRSWSRGRGIG